MFIITVLSFSIHINSFGQDECRLGDKSQEMNKQEILNQIKAKGGTPIDENHPYLKQVIQADGTKNLEIKEGVNATWNTSKDGKRTSLNVVDPSTGKLIMTCFECWGGCFGSGTCAPTPGVFGSCSNCAFCYEYTFVCHVNSW